MKPSNSILSGKKSLNLSLLESFRHLEQELLDSLKAFYGDRLVSLAIFGSVGRQTQRTDSDLDFLIVAGDLPRGRMARVEEFQVIEDQLTDVLDRMSKNGIDTYLSPVFKTPEELEQGSPLFLDLVEDARILYDPEDVLSSCLAGLKERLKALGSVRVRRGNAWHWVLKPDLKPCEVFEI
jgi:hypothetical protein